MSGSSHHHRCSLGATLAPVLLRAVLAITFIWAGLGKIIPQMPVDAAQVATLTSMGVKIPASGPAGTSLPAQPADAPDRPLPPPDAGPGDGVPASDSVVAPTPTERAANPGAGSAGQIPGEPAPAAVSGGAATADAPASSGSTLAAPAGPSSEVRVRRMWGLALRIHAAANPSLDATGKPQMKLWPGFLGSGNWPRYFAIAVVIAELGGGILLALGLLTRLGAVLLAGVMVGAIWLDQIGPAMQAGNTVLFFLPDHSPWDVAAWRPLLWQLSLLASAGAVAMLGAGAPSLDRALGWMKWRGDDDDL